MLQVPVEIKRSEIHGYGVFAVSEIREGRVVWAFTPGMDKRMSDYSIKYADPKTRYFVTSRGFINPNRKQEWVVCVDEAQFMNFPRRGEAANTMLGGILDGQYLLLAACDIPAGTEITVPPESDADYERKMFACNEPARAEN